MHGRDPAVLLIDHIIKRRHVDSGHLCRLFEEIRSCSTTLFPFLIQIHERKILRLSFSDIKQVKKFRQRFRIVGTGTAANDKRMFPRTLFRFQRDLRKIQNLQNICIAHLILYRNAKKIKILQRIL